MQVTDHSPEPDTKRRTKSVPKYPTLLAVLGIEDEGNAETVNDDEVTQLMAAMLANASGWEGFGGGV